MPQELQPLIIGSLSQLIRTLSLQAVLLELTKTVVGLDSTGLAAAAHQVGRVSTNHQQMERVFRVFLSGKDAYDIPRKELTAIAWPPVMSELD